MFGGYIPFIGFRLEYIDEDGYPTHEKTQWKADVFQIEWLGHSVLLFVCGIKSA